MQTNVYSQPQPVRPEKKNPKSAWKKRTAALSRWLHTYLSMVSFFVVLFFAVTGFTLNHAGWFDGKQVETKKNGKIPLAWIHTTDTAQIRKLEIVEFFRKNYRVQGYVSDFMIDEQQCALSFKGPGYSADAFINREDGAFQFTELRLGLVAVLNDLHKGRDSGQGWSWLIDVSAGFLTLVSLTGLLMLCFLKKKRMGGLLLALAGGLICYLIYYLLVP